jgi:hypothetical protein
VLADLRTIFAFYGDRIGLALALLAAAVFAALALFITSPIEPPEPVNGRVASLGLIETDIGSFPQATVMVDGVTVRVRLQRSSGCTVGDQLELNRERRLWGVAYRVRPGYRCGPLP